MLEFEIVSYEKIFNFNKKALENLCSSTANAHTRRLCKEAK